MLPAIELILATMRPTVPRRTQWGLKSRCRRSPFARYLKQVLRPTGRRGCYRLFGRTRLGYPQRAEKPPKSPSIELTPFRCLDAIAIALLNGPHRDRCIA